ncbi:Hypothetical predicted protein [Paramuricea clavata]|uniref:Asteroid domain-containing protein n=1 Tax=Paramuricea clavata TaxID=317549 RepID=A0A6S7J701_PARCT|nr:Hypothetical predicted protein [Paramuricea clavata]
MGIRGLTTYVKNLLFDEGQVWESYNLRDTNLVIDGRGLCYHICDGLNVKFGGQYDQLQNKLKTFFSELQSNNVVSYVVFDGIMTRDEKKLATHKKRNTERIQKMNNLWTSEKSTHVVLPRLTQLAVVEVLQEMEVLYAVADFEADCEIALLANELDALVLADDSDFYIFNIRRGYIPLKQHNFSGPNTTVRKFSFDGFTEHLGIDPSMSPLLASLVGNDYISDEMLKPFTDYIESLVTSSELEAGSEKVPTIAQFLSRHKSVSEAIHAVIHLFSDDDKVLFEKSIEEYQMEQSNLIGYFGSSDLSCNVHTYNGHSLPQWVVKLYRQGLMAFEGLACLCNRNIFLQTQSENIALPSAQICAQGLRWYYYALALNCEGTTNTVVSATELHSKNKAGVASMVTDGQLELGRDFDHTLTQGFTPESQARMDTKGFNDTSSSPLALAVPGIELQTQLVKAGIPSMITVQTEQEMDNDHTHTNRPPPGAQKETEFCVLSSLPELLQEQSKDSIPNMVTGQSESQEERETTHYDTTSSTSHIKQIKDSDHIHSILESEFDNLNENTVKSEEIGLLSSCDYTIEDVKFGKSDSTPQATTKDIVITEYVREGSSLVKKEVDLTRVVSEIRIQIRDGILEMSDHAKKSHLLNLLDSDLPFIHDLPIEHQIVVSALRYWVIHSQIKPTHLAALLVYYIGDSSKREHFKISLEAVHGFSQWQNVLYWVERLNTLFSSPFPQLQVAKLYDGVHVCLVYERLERVKAGIKYAESIVTNTNLYHHLYDVITKDLPHDRQFNQSRSSEKRRNKGGRTKGRRQREGKETKSKIPEVLKGNKFAHLSVLNPDEDY